MNYNSTQLGAPVLLLLFNRLENTKKVFSKIRQAKPKFLFVAADGPRETVKDEDKACQSVRHFVLSNIDWDCTVKTLFRSRNLGSGKAVSSAITWFFETVEYGIILEDDCVPVDSFFNFCEVMLKKYEKEESIGMVCGSNYLFREAISDNFFLSKFCFIWGWATWRRVWKDYRLEIKDYNASSFKFILDRRFRDNLISLYHIRLMEYEKHKKVDAWDIQFTYLFYSKCYLSVIPEKNQITNIGYIGTHASGGGKVRKLNSLGAPTYELNSEQLLDSYNPPLIPNKVYDNQIKLNYKTIVRDDMGMQPSYKVFILKFHSTLQRLYIYLTKLRQFKVL
jgi:hypothetical protein